MSLLFHNIEVADDMLIIVNQHLEARLAFTPLPESVPQPPHFEVDEGGGREMCLSPLFQQLVMISLGSAMSNQ